MDNQKRSFKNIPKSDNHVSLGQRIKEIRKSKSMTQSDLAKMIVVDDKGTTMDLAVLSKIERGVSNITLEKLFAISKALNVTPSELFTLFRT